MYTVISCHWCYKPISRPIGEEEKHIWFNLELETGVWCPNCRQIFEIRKSIKFCSSKCLKAFVASDSFEARQITFRREAVEKAKEISKHEMAIDEMLKRQD